MPSSQFSPIKSKRLDEKASLQSLNSRLEIYVMRVKEMEDAKTVAERELETIRDRMQQDMDVVRLRLTKELDDTRKYVYPLSYNNLHNPILHHILVTNTAITQEIGSRTRPKNALTDFGAGTARRIG